MCASVQLGPIPDSPAEREFDNSGQTGAFAAALDQAIDSSGDKASKPATSEAQPAKPEHSAQPRTKHTHAIDDSAGGEAETNAEPGEDKPVATAIPTPVPAFTPPPVAAPAIRIGSSSEPSPVAGDVNAAQQSNPQSRPEDLAAVPGKSSETATGQATALHTTEQKGSRSYSAPTLHEPVQPSIEPSDAEKPLGDPELSDVESSQPVAPSPSPAPEPAQPERRLPVNTKQVPMPVPARTPENGTPAPSVVPEVEGEASQAASQPPIDKPESSAAARAESATRVQDVPPRSRPSGEHHSGVSQSAGSERPNALPLRTERNAPESHSEPGALSVVPLHQQQSTEPTPATQQIPTVHVPSVTPTHSGATPPATTHHTLPSNAPHVPTVSIAAESGPTIPTIASAALREIADSHQLKVGFRTPELGRIEITAASQDSSLSATVHVERESVQRAIAAELPSLERHLPDSKLEVRTLDFQFTNSGSDHPGSGRHGRTPLPITIPAASATSSFHSLRTPMSSSPTNPGERALDLRI